MITTLLFDLGNVLLHFDHGLIASGLARYAPSAPGLIRDPAAARLLEAYERGRVSSADFYAEILDFLEVTREKLDYPTFARIWSDIFTPNRELLALLPGLAARYSLGLISNTNELHIARVREHFPEALAPFRATVFSHEAGCCKPDERIYLRALDLLGARPLECFYVDDIERYVAAAAALGIDGVQFRSTAGLLAEFASRGILPSIPERKVDNEGKFL